MTALDLPKTSQLHMEKTSANAASPGFDGTEKEGGNPTVWSNLPNTMVLLFQLVKVTLDSEKSIELMSVA